MKNIEISFVQKHKGSVKSYLEQKEKKSFNILDKESNEKKYKDFLIKSMIEKIGKTCKCNTVYLERSCRIKKLKLEMRRYQTFILYMISL